MPYLVIWLLSLKIIITWAVKITLKTNLVSYFLGRKRFNYETSAIASTFYYIFICITKTMLHFWANCHFVKRCFSQIKMARDQMAVDRESWSFDSALVGCARKFLIWSVCLWMFHLKHCFHVLIISNVFSESKNAKLSLRICLRLI